MPRKSGLTGQEPPLIECDLPLGQPGLVAHNQLLLSGWAASSNGVTGVVVNVDERVWTASYGLDTPSLAERLPDVEGAGRAGYRLAIDTSSWTPGPRYVAVSAYDPDGRRSAIEGPVDVQPFAAPAPESSDDPGALEHRGIALSLDSPAIEAGAAEVEGALEIRGWTCAGEGVDAVLVTLDGVLQYEALRPISRPDLLRPLGRDMAADAGFSLVIDPIECPPGRHLLTVAALSRDGHVAGIECDLTCLPAPGLAPQLGDDDAASFADEERPRSDGSLLAEADAALCRAEVRLSQAGQERARRELREAESDPGAPVGRLRRELATTRHSLVSMREEVEESAEREKRAAREAEEKERQLEALGGELSKTRGDLNAVQREIGATRYDFERVNKELSATRDDLEHRAALLARVERSLSWKITRPLRAVKRLFVRRPKE